MDGFIFDFNGTMFYDGKLQERAWRSFLEQKIGRPVTDGEFHQYIHGINADVTFAYFLGKKLSRNQVMELEEEKEIIYRRLCLESPDFHLADGLAEFLDEAADRGISMTIATASSCNNVRFFFEHLPLDRWFSFEKVVYNDGKIAGKPNPDLFSKAAERIGTDTRKCAIFEDSKSGIEAARRACAGRIVGVASMLEEQVLYDLGASVVIKDYRNWKNLF